MNHQFRSLFNSSTCAWVGFASLFWAAVLVCLPANAAQEHSQQSAWNATGSLATGRFGHTATLLLNGKVLVVGGRVCSSGCTEFSSAELYDPATGTWSATGNLSVPRHAHVAVRLPSGRVLVAGGFGALTTWNAAELYDPDTGAWSPTGNLANARAFATATLLANGKVLVAGGGPVSTAPLNTAELYDPGTGAWTTAGMMNAARAFHTATLLGDGRILIASGSGGAIVSPIMLLTAELYDPSSGSWTLTGSLGTSRAFHAQTLLPNGKVLVAGGSNLTTTIYDSAELYDPATGLWSATGKMTSARNSYTATLLTSGNVLAAGGFNNDPVNFTQKSTELFDPDTGTWSASADLNIVRGNHTATTLADGSVLVTGGNGGGSPALTSAELLVNRTLVAPQITGASISGKMLFVEGQDFDDGAKVLLNDEKQKTVNDEVKPSSVLRCKKAGKFIGRGETVTLKVRNADGTESAEFRYTRPVE